jgi:hypothetical protein
VAGQSWAKNKKKSELKPIKEMEKTNPVSGTVMSTQPDIGSIFCISFLVFSYKNISFLGDSKVGSHLNFFVKTFQRKVCSPMTRS